jgi:hypothetical protein
MQSRSIYYEHPDQFSVTLEQEFNRKLHELHNWYGNLRSRTNVSGTSLPMKTVIDLEKAHCVTFYWEHLRGDLLHHDEGTSQW